jgi:hypothetical protein
MVGRVTPLRLAFRAREGVVVGVLVEVEVVAVCRSCCVVGVLVTVPYVAYLNFVRIKM